MKKKQGQTVVVSRIRKPAFIGRGTARTRGRYLGFHPSGRSATGQKVTRKRHQYVLKHTRRGLAVRAGLSKRPPTRYMHTVSLRGATGRDVSKLRKKYGIKPQSRRVMMRRGWTGKMKVVHQEGLNEDQRELLIEAILNEIRITTPQGQKAMKIIRRKLKQAAATGDKKSERLLNRLNNSLVDREMKRRGGAARQNIGRMAGLNRVQYTSNERIARRLRKKHVRRVERDKFSQGLRRARFDSPLGILPKVKRA